jgi:hypothetical protein
MSARTQKRKKMFVIIKKFSKSITKDLKKAIKKAYALDRVLGKVGGHRGFEGAAANINQGIEDAMEALHDVPGMVREFLEDEEADTDNE